MSQPSQFYNDSIFWVEVDKIKPNPYQPRKEFDQAQLQALSDSIRQYGVLQALVVTRKEVPKADGGLAVEYELIAGERRLRASKLAGLTQVPVLIKTGEQSDLLKLELAIIENVQREDLNPVDRARAFQKLVDEFGFKHAQIAEKIGKSREYVSNSLRLLTLPSDILDALSQGKISEGHARPLMMLSERPMEQSTLFKEIMFRKMTVREAEMIARKIATDKVRKKEVNFDPEIKEIEEKLTESLGTRVHIERREVGGKVQIDFFSNDDLRMILDLVNKNRAASPEMLNRFISQSMTSQTQNQNQNQKQDIAAQMPQPGLTPEQQKAVQRAAEMKQEGAQEMPQEPKPAVQQPVSEPVAAQHSAPVHEAPRHIHPTEIDTQEFTFQPEAKVVEPKPTVASDPAAVEEIKKQAEALTQNTPLAVSMPEAPAASESATVASEPSITAEKPIDDRSPEEIKKDDDEEIYSVKNFTI